MLLCIKNKSFYRFKDVSGLTKVVQESLCMIGLWSIGVVASDVGPRSLFVAASVPQVVLRPFRHSSSSKGNRFIQSQ